MNGDEEDYIPENETGESDHPGEEIEEVAALKAEIAELKDRALRAMAEAENTRRRAEREKRDASQYAIANFARAINACPPEARESASEQVKGVIEGVEATDRQLMAALERYGVKPIETENAKFDPNFHQAIAEVPGGGKPAGTIVDVVQVGYVIGERLLRPAMVTVARAGDGGSAEPQT